MVTEVRKPKIKRLFAAVVAVLTLCIVTTSTVLAVNIDNFIWHQSVSSKKVYVGQLNPGSNSNLNGIKCYFVAHSPEDGEFEVVLQRKGLLGVWQNAGIARRATQTSEWRYDARNGTDVPGQPNLLVWPATQSGEYRIVLQNPTNPQETGFTRVEVWAY